MQECLSFTILQIYIIPDLLADLNCCTTDLIYNPPLDLIMHNSRSHLFQSYFKSIGRWTLGVVSGISAGQIYWNSELHQPQWRSIFLFAGCEKATTGFLSRATSASAQTSDLFTHLGATDLSPTAYSFPNMGVLNLFQQ